MENQEATCRTCGSPVNDHRALCPADFDQVQRDLEDDRMSEDRPATHGEAMQEYARNAGEDHPERDWILTPYDVWLPNPHFVGQRGRHPEEPTEEDLEEMYGKDAAEPPTKEMNCVSCGKPVADAPLAAERAWCAACVAEVEEEPDDIPF